MTLLDLGEIVVYCLGSFGFGLVVGFKVQMTIQFFRNAT